MTIQQDILLKIDKLPINLKEPIRVLLSAITEQKQERFSNNEIEQRLVQELDKIINEENN